MLKLRRLSLLAAAVIATCALTSVSLACASEKESQPAPGTSQPSGDESADATISAKLRTVRVARFNQPVEVKSAPGYPGLLFVVEQRGRVMVLRRGKKIARPFLDMRSKVSFGGEEGLLSVAFPPNYRKSGRFYVYFTDRAGDIRVSEYRRQTAVRARQGSSRSVIRIGHPGNSNHNGGQLHFLGSRLYFGTGDGGGGGDQAGNAQNLDSLLGKLIRIDPRARNGRPYTVPADNPFVGQTGRDEIFSYGLRNPFRWSFDRTSSPNKVRIAIGDVGQDRFEEINYLNLSRARGGNFGWNRWEGNQPFEGGGDGTIKPSLALPNPPNCSVIGGLVVRDRKLPALRGRYLFTDFCDARILSFKPKLGRVSSKPTGLRINNVTSFGDNAAGAVFVTTLNGNLFRIRQ